MKETGSEWMSRLISRGITSRLLNLQNGHKIIKTTSREVYTEDKLNPSLVTRLNKPRPSLLHATRV